MRIISDQMFVLAVICLYFTFIPISCASPVIVQYFHQIGCHDCEITDQIINRTEIQYKNDDVVILKFETSTADGFNQWNKYGFLGVPAIVINNETKIPKKEITEERLRISINEYLTKRKNEQGNLHLNTTLNSPVAYAETVSIQYFHQKGCHDCGTTDPIIDRIETQYIYNDVVIKRIETNTADGFNQWNKYGFAEVPAIVINNETKVPKEEITEEKLKASINGYLNKRKKDTVNTTEDIKRDEQNSSGYINTSLNLPFAYSLGFFAGFSPCLMAILGFLLSFTTGTSSNAKDGAIRATVFGLGLVSSYIILGLCFLSFKKSISDWGNFSYITGIIMIFIGLNLLGILKSPVTLDNFFQNSARKYASTMGGVFFLGILFSFVKVPCTAPLLLVLLNKTITSGTVNNLILLFAFSVGVLTPFIGVGLVGGYTLSKKIRSYRKYIKNISGIAIILFGLWIMIQI